MKRLKTLLHSNYFYILLYIILLFYLSFYFYIRKDNDTNIDINSNSFSGIITDYRIKEDLVTIEINGSEKIIGYYYDSFNLNLGDQVEVEGKFSKPKNNTYPNLFNYKKYLRYKNIYMTMNINSIKKISDNKYIFYKIKNSIIKHISKYKSSNYLNTFILGNKSMIDISSYQENGISHLLAISGMHISLLSLILFILFKKKVIISFILIFYMFLTGLSPSVVRSVFLFILLSLNKKYDINLSTIKVFLLTLLLILFINPNFLFDTGFIYSFTICFSLILSKDKISGSYINKLFKISFISFIVSLPITLYYFYEVNFLSIILNIFYVPFVSIIVFPLSLITFFIPAFDNLFFIVINILEKLSNFTSSFNLFKLVFGKVNFLFIISYYFVASLYLFCFKRRYLFLILLILFIAYNQNIIFPKSYFLMIDVGQGDSLLIHSNNKTMLLDTGGKVSFNNKTKSITDKTLIPLFKSLGIRKIDIMCFSHGDYDHLGEAINLINNIKVNRIIFNKGDLNNNEKKVIEVAKSKNIKYETANDFRLGKFYFKSLNKAFLDENDSSNVFLVKIMNYYLLLTGDASSKTEEYILSKYNLPHITFLKVGHHGSKTSTSKLLVNKIKPSYSLISVGKNNRYGHPNKEVLDNLEDSKIYRTDQDGSIMFKIKNNKLKIETCTP